jgi:hypothetical protein
MLAVRRVDALLEQLEHVLEYLRVSSPLVVVVTHIDTRVQEIYPLPDLEILAERVVQRFQIRE